MNVLTHEIKWRAENVVECIGGWLVKDYQVTEEATCNTAFSETIKNNTIISAISSDCVCVLICAAII